YPNSDALFLCEKISVEADAVKVSTMQTTLERLYKKRLVSRFKVRHAYQYNSQLSRADLIAKLLGDVVEVLHDGNLETILSGFVSAAEKLDENSLDHLETLITQKRLMSQKDE
ncbi:MAG: BlaI/MecI/CopY family transcriptional regulator, partial [Exilibacterium sp.]